MAATQIKKINGSDQAAVLKGISRLSEGDIKLVDGNRVSVTACGHKDVAPGIVCHVVSQMSYDAKREIARQMLADGTSFALRNGGKESFVFELHEE